VSLSFSLFSQLPLLSLLLLHDVQVVLEVLLPVHGVHHPVTGVRLKLLLDVVPPGVAFDVVSFAQHIQKVLTDLKFVSVCERNIDMTAMRKRREMRQRDRIRSLALMRPSLNILSLNGLI